jgi:hypothetical protein
VASAAAVGRLTVRVRVICHHRLFTFGKCPL